MATVNPEALERYIFEQSTLEADEAKRLTMIPHDSPGDCSGRIIEQIERGEVKTGRIMRGGEAYGFAVYSVHDLGGKRELLVNAAYKQGGKPMGVDSYNCMDALAIAEGCESIRFHTVRRGLIKQATQNDFYISEVILRKNLKQ